MKRTKIRRVSSKRSTQLREYSKLRKAFLEAHPWCQWWLQEHGLSESDVDRYGWTDLYDPCGNWMAKTKVPSSCEIHHMNGRFGSRLNKTEWWLAVSREGHEWVHNNPKEARLRGYLMDR